MEFKNSDLKEASFMVPAKEGSPSYPGVPNVELVGIRKDTGTYPATIFRFENDRGEVLEHREFDPKKGPNQTDDEFIKSQQLSHSRVAHISRAYLTEAEFKTIEGNDWASYINATVRALGIANGVPMRAKGQKGELKVVYRLTNNKYYSSLPMVPPFLSTVNHPKTLSVNPKYDTMVMPTMKPDIEQPKTPVTGFGSPTSQPAPAPTSGGSDNW